MVSLDTQLAEVEFALAEATAARLSERCVLPASPRRCRVAAMLQGCTACMQPLDRQGGSKSCHSDGVKVASQTSVNRRSPPWSRRQVEVLREELSELRAGWAADKAALQDAVDSARTVQL